MKKIIALVLACAMVFALCACGSSSSSTASTTASTSATEAPAAEAEATEAPAEEVEPAKIALVTETVGTQVFLQSMVDGLNASAEKYGFEATCVECPDSAAFEENMRALVAEGYDLIIGGGWQAGDAINKIATEFPEACSYALIDSSVDAENVKCISYDEHEGAYLIGVMAALVTKNANAANGTDTHQYGCINVNEGAGSWKWRYGYMEGVLSIDPDAEFHFNYTASYSDPAKAKEFAYQQFEQGCIFINSAAAGGDSGTFEAAQEKGFYTSGQDVDLTDPSNPYIVSSQIKDTYASIQYIIDCFCSTGWSSENSVLGVEDGAIGAVYVTHESENPRSDMLTDDDIAYLKDVANQIANHEVAAVEGYPEEDAYWASK